jgi:spore photoproduct lyase
MHTVSEHWVISLGKYVDKRKSSIFSAGSIFSQRWSFLKRPGTLAFPIHRIVCDASVEDSPMARRVRERLPDVPLDIQDDAEPTPGAEPGETLLYLKHYKGAFLRFCPGTRFYHCCGYRIVHIGENCPMSCSYCILQAYFQDKVLKVWANQDDLFTELDKAFGADTSLRYRVGTGEFTDSLALEPITAYGRDLAAFTARYANVVMEFKSKTADISWLPAADPRRLLPAWSVNAPAIVAGQEHGAASLEERLQAARTCAEQGFRVCLHFDPILPFAGWEQGYDETVEMIFDHLRPEQIAYVSLGSFRFMPDLKKAVVTGFPQATYIFDEFMPGLDGKMRLVRPKRVAQFRRIAEKLRAGGLDKELYFCMESDEVWQAVLGRRPKDLGGLGRHLMELAFGG